MRSSIRRKSLVDVGLFMEEMQIFLFPLIFCLASRSESPDTSQFQQAQVLDLFRRTLAGLVTDMGLGSYHLLTV